jgi:hypothetical protein
MAKEICGSDSQETTQEELGQQLATTGWDRLGKGIPGGLQGDKYFADPQVPELPPAQGNRGTLY